MIAIETQSPAARDDRGGDGGRLAGGTPGGAGRAPAGVACQTVTTAYRKEEKEEKSPLPGTKKKQADALVKNIGWLSETFGPERIGFGTLTVRFVIADWQDAELRQAIDEHNLEVRRRWLEGGGNPAQECWWDVTEITLDHLCPSPEWLKQMAELQLAKEVEAAIKQGGLAGGDPRFIQAEFMLDERFLSH